MAKSQNGWAVLPDGSAYLYQWVIPTEAGTVTFPLRRGPAGFVLTHWALWFSENIEPLVGAGDDFGWALRRIAGSDVYSNHASGTAEDLNASQHPSGVKGSFTEDQVQRMNNRLNVNYDGVIRWGGNYLTSTDEMHFEINVDRPHTRLLASSLLETGRGKRLTKANPSQVQYL